MIHLAGQWMIVHGVLRQRCMWCGEVVLEVATDSVDTSAIREQGTWVREDYTPVHSPGGSSPIAYPEGSCVEAEITTWSLSTARVGEATVG